MINKREQKEELQNQLNPRKNPKYIKFDSSNDPETETVKVLAFYGNSLSEIASYTQKPLDYIKKHYEDLVESVRIAANTEVAESVYEQAVSGDFKAQKFWLENMSEQFSPSVNIDHTSSDGSMSAKQQTTILLAVKNKFKDVTNEPEYEEYQIIEQEEGDGSPTKLTSQPQASPDDLTEEELVEELLRPTGGQA